MTDLPVVISASAGSIKLVLLNTFQKRNNPKKIGMPMYAVKKSVALNSLKTQKPLKRMIMEKKKSAAQAVYGWKGDLKTRVSRSMF